MGDCASLNSITVLNLTYFVWNEVNIVAGVSTGRYSFSSFIHGNTQNSSSNLLKSTKLTSKLFKDDKIYVMGGMGNQNYLEYTPCALEYNPEKAKKLEHLSKKKKLTDKARKQMSIQSPTIGSKLLLPTSDKEVSFNSDHDEYGFGRDAEESDLPQELQMAKQIKREANNFTSFMPLPDSFHRVISTNKKFKKTKAISLSPRVFDKKQFKNIPTFQ